MISRSDGELQKSLSSHISCAHSATFAKLSELNDRDEKSVGNPKNSPKNINSIQKDGIGGYRFVKVRITCP